MDTKDKYKRITSTEKRKKIEANKILITLMIKE
jgi:hypothetical protein